jgi:hypothetical protein
MLADLNVAMDDSFAVQGQHNGDHLVHQEPALVARSRQIY